VHGSWEKVDGQKRPREAGGAETGLGQDCLLGQRNPGHPPRCCLRMLVSSQTPSSEEASATSRLHVMEAIVVPAGHRDL